MVQDVLLTIHRVRHTYDPSRPFTAWLGAIAHRRSVDALRRKVRINAAETFSPIAYETYANPSASRGVEPHEGMSLAEAAVVSGQSMGALRVSLHRAIRALQRTLSSKVKE